MDCAALEDDGVIERRPKASVECRCAPYAVLYKYYQQAVLCPDSLRFPPIPSDSLRFPPPNSLVGCPECRENSTQTKQIVC